MKDDAKSPPVMATPPGDLLEQVLRMQPRLHRTSEVSMPPDLRSELRSVTVHQLGAIAYLPPDGASMRQFAEAVGITGAAATALADRMIKQGLAERRYNPADRRVVWLAPTEKARALLETYRSWQREAMASAVKRLQPSQLATFLEVLNVLTEQMNG
ncbi:MAG: MarR family winged helix-turn-helix transcriptional regulator [Candidatus Dormibacteria bacterium]